MYQTMDRIHDHFGGTETSQRCLLPQIAPIYKGKGSAHAAPLNSTRLQRAHYTMSYTLATLHHSRTVHLTELPVTFANFSNNPGCASVHPIKPNCELCTPYYAQTRPKRHCQSSLACPTARCQVSTLAARLH
jgi:hypothetical protein